jgi:hypothetical protein
LSQTAPSRKALACRRKFLRVFPRGFRDETYVDWERGYKWLAHVTWAEQLGRERLARLLARGKFAVIAQTAITIESRTNLLFSFEKMALRDALRTGSGARDFARGLDEFLYGSGELDTRFERWRDVIASLPRKQTRVLTWPIVTVFPFIAAPREHIFLKPMVTRTAARKYGVDFRYASKPNWLTYESMLCFAAVVRRDLRDLRPRDMIDLQSFIWIQGSDEYA